MNPKCYYRSIADTACMGAQMSFEELFDHLERYTKCKDYRWKLVLRVKFDEAATGRCVCLEL